MAMNLGQSWEQHWGRNLEHCLAEHSAKNWVIHSEQH